MAEPFGPSDQQSEAIAPLLPRLVGKPWFNNGRVISRILHRFRDGLCWPAVPVEDGPRTTLTSRFRRWSRRGLWQELFAALVVFDDPREIASICSTIVHAYRSAADANREEHDQAVGQCPGGNDAMVYRDDAELTGEDMSAITTFAAAGTETVQVYPQQSVYNMPRIDPMNQDIVLQNIGSTAVTLVFGSPPNMALGLAGAILIPPGGQILLTTKEPILSAMARNRAVVGGPHAQAAANATSFTALSDRVSATLVVTRGTAIASLAWAA